MTNAEYQALKKQENNIKVGQIFYAQWGFEQTNIDWYKVVGRTGKRIKIQELKETRTYTGDMQGHAIPVDEPKNAEILTAVANAAYTKVTRCGYAIYLNEWDGKSKNFTCYA